MLVEKFGKRVGETAAQAIALARVESTWSSNESDKAFMSAFFELGKVGHKSKEISREEKLCIWVAGFMYHYCFYDVSTIRKKIVSGVNQLSPKHEKFKTLELALLGMKKMQAGIRKKRLPLTPERSMAFNKFIDRKDITESGLVAADLIAIMGLLRSDEFLTKGPNAELAKKLTLEKLSIGSDNLADIMRRKGFERALSYWKKALDEEDTRISLTIRLDASKTDRLRLGASVNVAAVKAGFADKLIYDMCPLRALFNHWEVRLAEGEVFSENSPVFAQALTGHGTSFLSYATLTAYDKMRSKLMGLGDNYVRGHDRRKGGASALAAVGLSHYHLRVAGRWSVGTTERYVEVERGTIVEYQRLAITEALNRYRTANLQGSLPVWWIDEVDKII